jgi:hypothetical protein
MSRFGAIHDARLVALMTAQGLAQIPTLNAPTGTALTADVLDGKIQSSQPFTRGSQVMSLQLEEAAEEVLRTLQAQANARNMAFADYLRQFADTGILAPPNGQPSLEELDTLLDQLAEGTVPIPSLPTDFSRKDIYADHD